MTWCGQPRRERTLPITTGRVGIHQRTGDLTFYNGNPSGTHHELWRGRAHWPGWWGGGCCWNPRFDRWVELMTDPKWLTEGDP